MYETIIAWLRRWRQPVVRKTERNPRVTSSRRWSDDAPHDRHRHLARPADVQLFFTNFAPHTPQHG
ncbi:hypothetical protein HMPREF9607_01819 [Cutibacterium modestum HL044PA1]|uniref:Uncharacterized protein n=1 Tax=Cutibacterium modestum HL044PA1 TaxID=765109 RepID=A0ABN0C3W1_9ACTN|nr:hypothetical protein HMPREF9607_01819 [Cutibacterium modestum HL044PA1]